MKRTSFYFRWGRILLVLLFGRIGSLQAADVVLSWRANTESDLAGYKVYYGTSSGNYGTPTNVGNVTSYILTGLNSGTFYFAVKAYDTSGNESGFSTELSLYIAPDITPPVVSSIQVTGISSSSATITWTTNEASDTQVEYGTTTTYGSSSSLSSTLLTAHSVNLSGLSASTLYHYRVKSRDSAGNLVTSGDSTFTTTASLPPNLSGLVAAYGFNENSGSSTADASSNSNTGTISGATWTTQGKYGSALSFDGSTNSVAVNDSSSLDLSASMTLEAWVNPTALSGGSASGWRTVILKQQTGDLSYGLYANTDQDRPSGYVYIGGELDTLGTAQLPLNSWTHLAATYDGSALRLFVNGVQVSTRAVSGNMAASSGALRIGGNSVWGEYFSGVIDEVRVYNRPLSQAEIQNDMSTPVGVSTPPTGNGCDVNGDGTTNAVDLQAVINAILSANNSATYDINRDGVVNVLDLQLLSNVILGVGVCP